MDFTGVMWMPSISTEWLIAAHPEDNLTRYTVQGEERPHLHYDLPLPVKFLNQLQIILVRNKISV